MTTKSNKSFGELRFMMLALILFVAVMCINTSEVNAGSWHKVYLTPGQTYDVSKAQWNTTVYINKAGNYTLKGQSTKCKVVVQSGGANIYLNDGLKIDPGIKANIGASTASMIIEDMDGTVKLISKKGSKAYFGGYLTAPAIEKMGYNSKLVFETEDPSDPGTIIAWRRGTSSSAGIGGVYHFSIPYVTGNMEFNSGNVEATGGSMAAGIGGAASGSAYKITINGGNIKAEGGTDGTGIGGGFHGNASNITINGGTVEAVGTLGAGIGSGEQSKYAKNIIINGGNIKARSGLGAGIGGGQRSEVENLRINGGTIYAYSRNTAIGSTCDQHLGILKSLYITGGNIVAESEHTAIGAASNSPGPNNIYISGGVIDAKADYYAIGGGGFSSLTDGERVTNVTISGGTIKAEGGTDDIGTNDAWMTGFNTTITGGTLLADRDDIDSTPKDQFGNEVKRTDITIDGLNTIVKFPVKDTDITGIPATYGLNDVYTQEGKLYFWIPDNSAVNMAAVTEGNTLYHGNVAAGQSGTLYEDTRVRIESDDEKLKDGSGTLYEGAASINKLKAPEVSPGYSIIGYKISGTDVIFADKDGTLKPNVTANGTAYTDANGKWICKGHVLIDLKAVVEENEYTIAFDSNVPENTKSTPNPDGNMDDVTLKYTAEYSIPAADFSLKGYTFTGWNTKPDGSGISCSAGDNKSRLAESDTVTLYAQWEPKTYEVTFSYGGTSYKQNMVYDEYAVLTTFENTGFAVPTDKKFAGWRRNGGSFGGTIYGDGASVVNLCNANNISGNVTGYELEPYFIDANQPAVVITKDGETYTNISVSLKLEQDGSTQTVFMKNENGVYVPESNEEILEGKYDIIVGGTDTQKDIMIQSGGEKFAHLEYYSVEVICDEKLASTAASSGEPALEGSQVEIRAENIPGNGYVFDKWTVAAGVPKFVDSDVYDQTARISIIGKTTMKANARPVNYTIKFDANKPAGASGEVSGDMADQKFVYDKQQQLTTDAYALTGYIFMGWNTKTDGTGTAYTNKQSVKNLTTEDGKVITLYAQWKADEYNIVFNGNTADSGQVADITGCVYDQDVVMPTCGFVKEAYHFIGWCDAIDGIGILYKSGEKAKNLASYNGATVVLYAIWEHDYYTVKFDCGTGTGQVPDVYVWTDEEYTLSNPGFIKDGYELTGWNTSADGTGDSYELDKKVKNLIQKDEEITLYAQWKACDYEITFDANGGRGTMEPQKMTYDKADNLTDNVFEAPKGKKFVGWVADDGNDQTENVIYENQSEVINQCQYNEDGELIGYVMVAQWEEIAPNTGDDAPLGLLFAVMLASVVAMITILFIRRGERT